MPHPKEICIEDLELSEREGTANQAPYIRCVALPGGEPGLALDSEGVVRWMPDGPAAYGLWVSADERLVLLRGANAGPITVERGGRRVDAPEGKPVILVHQDLLRVNGRRLRVHVHGETDQVHEPQPLRGMGRLARATAAALALGAVVGGGVSEARQAGGEPPPIEVREHPPSDVPMPRRAVTCAITAMKRGAVLMVHATCPGDRAIAVGTYGRILDPKTNSPMTSGNVRVTAVTGHKVVCRALQLKRPVKARKLQLMVQD